MKTRLFVFCIVTVLISIATLFFVTNDLGGYSYIPIDCKIKDMFGYFSDSPESLVGCFRVSHPAQFQ
ncbi:MAG: hypothetical protein K5790_01615 [Nitrosopumilus sp.]|uniref:hypothetical protein n=1 Tax=Nitrosopumilus sp. TaxID=2024843 RepID=UPI00247DD57E|nr:hypothetical protein [Nitrosopumilus sp.]MCV0391971.1 hypothetical protein [Nitrosopumilus sp.]